MPSFSTWAGGDVLRAAGWHAERNEWRRPIHPFGLAVVTVQLQLEREVWVRQGGTSVAYGPWTMGIDRSTSAC